MVRLGRIVGVVALLVWSLPSLAHAQGATPAQQVTPPQQGPCAADFEKLCKDVKPGGGRLLACLKQHEAELSATCKQAQGKAHGRMAQRRPSPACKGDIEKFCKDVQPGGGRIVKCLNEHKSELSGECQAQHKRTK